MGGADVVAAEHLARLLDAYAALLVQVEDAVRREYQDGSFSGNARDSSEKALNSVRDKVNQANQNQ